MTGRQLNDTIVSLPIFNCKKCSNLLKLPIILVKGTGNVCGVCSETYDEILRTHNEALETVLQHLILPCKYSKNGCNKKLEYSEIDKHELVCKYREFICPLKELKKCSWALNLSQIEDHFTKSHQDEMVFLKSKPYFKMDIDVTNNSEWIKLVHDYNNLFILHLRYKTDCSRLQCALYQIKNEKEFLEYNYTVTYKESHYIGNVSTLAEDKGFNDYFNTNQILSVDLPIYFEPFLTISVEIKNTNITLSKIDNKLLKAFECPICNNYMKSPIVQCLKGHSLCNICKVKLQNCPTCRDRFGETRNYSLEQLGNNLNFPCMYRENGCNVIKTGDRIVKHEQECSLLIYNCPVGNGCTWTGLYDNMLGHVLGHSNSIKSNFYLQRVGLNSRNFTYYMIAYDRLFYVSIDFGPRDYYHDSRNTVWDVQLIGPKSEAKSFKFEFGLIANNSMDNKLTFTNICREFPGNPCNYGPSFQIPDKIIQQFKINKEVVFYCKIVKVIVTHQKQMLCIWKGRQEREAHLQPNSRKGPGDMSRFYF